MNKLKRKLGLLSGIDVHMESDSSDEEKEEQVPIGFNYVNNFPSLPDQDGKGKKLKEADERRKRMQQQQKAGVNYFAF